MLNILHVITTLQTGGAERMLTRIIIDSKNEARHAVIVLSAGGQFYDLLRSNDIPIFVYPVKNPLLALWHFIGLLIFARRVKPSVICGWMAHGNVMAALLKKIMFSPARLVWHIRMTLYDLQKETLSQRIALWLCKWLSRMPDHILYNSQEGQRQHEAFGFHANHSALVDNGFDLDVLYPDLEIRSDIRRDLKVAEDNILIGYVARYHAMKNHALFIQAAADVIAVHPNVRFVLAGLGCDNHNIQLTSMLSHYQLQDAFILLGERKDIFRINNALDIAVNTASWGEGFSNSLAEAMACGVPCVATQIGSAEYIIGDTGMTVPPDDKTALATALASMIEKLGTDAPALKSAARARIVDHFDIHTVTRHYLSYYRG